MPNVEFSSKQIYIPQPQKGSGAENSPLVRSVMNTGVTKNKYVASFILLCATLVIFGISGYFFQLSFQTPTAAGQEELYIEDIPLEIRNQIPYDELQKIPSRG